MVKTTNQISINYVPWRIYESYVSGKIIPLVLFFTWFLVNHHEFSSDMWRFACSRWWCSIIGSPEGLAGVVNTGSSRTAHALSGKEKKLCKVYGEAVNHHELDVFLRRAPKFAITKRTPAMPAAQRSASWMAGGGDPVRWTVRGYLTVSSYQ